MKLSKKENHKDSVLDNNMVCVLESLNSKGNV